MFCEIGVSVVCCLLLAGAQELSIAPPGTQIKTFDSGMIFTCTLSGHRYTSPVLRWIGPNRRYINETKGRVYIERQDQFILRLYITEIQENDAGLYSCEADVSGNTMVEEARMFLYEDIKFQETPTFVEGVIGSDQLLECRASGQPEPEISWRFNNHRITQDKVKYVEEEKRGLRVSNLDLRDAGNYECRAEVSSHGNLKVRTITVDVLYAPVMLRELPSTVNAIRGRPMELTCEGAGNPPVTYEWFKELRNSRETPFKTQLSISENKLRIASADEKDEAKYFCRISNSLGSKETTANLSLIIPPQVRGLPPLRTAVEGQTVELQCEASGFPTPKISWTRGRQQLDSPSKRDGHHQDLGRIFVEAAPPGVSRLVIHEIQRNETETYTCSAKNEGGTDSKSISLSVEYLPTVKVDGPKVEMGWPGRVVTFTCAAQGLPPPTVTWLHDGRNVIDIDATTVRTSRLQVIASTLQIKIGDRGASVGSVYGGYMCIAKNSHGHDIGNMTLKEAETPDTPGNVSVVEERSTWVRLSADRPRRDGGMGVSRWKVVHELVPPGATPAETTVFKDNDNLTVGGLKPGSAYTFYLHAGNAVGFGKPVKFRVRTPKRMQFKEQSDVAEHSGKGGGGGGGGGREGLRVYPEGSKDPVLAADTVAEEEMEGAGKEGNTAREGGGGRGGGGLPGFVVLATAVGCAVVMATVVLFVVCFAWRRRRRQVARRSYGAKDPKKKMAFADGSGSDHRLPVYNNRALPASRKNSHNNCACASPVPFPVPVRLLQSASSTHSLIPSGGKSSAAAGDAGVDGGGEGSDGGGGGDTLQRRAWNSMMVQRNGAAAGEERFEPSLDLPSPPPKFLLDAVRCYEAGEVRRAPVAAAAAGAYGYRSADSVDDDIDEIDFTIRVPSYRGPQIQPYPPC